MCVCRVPTCVADCRAALFCRGAGECRLSAFPCSTGRWAPEPVSPGRVRMSQVTLRAVPRHHCRAFGRVGPGSAPQGVGGGLPLPAECRPWAAPLRLRLCPTPLQSPRDSQRPGRRGPAPARVPWPHQAPSGHVAGWVGVFSLSPQDGESELRFNLLSKVERQSPIVGVSVNIVTVFFYCACFSKGGG